jgi:hypothetical protein
MSFKCDICNTEYKSYQSFWNHNKIKHPENKKKKNIDLICQKCNKNFLTKHGLKYHNENVCKVKPNETNELKEQIIKLKNEVELLKQHNELNNIIEQNEIKKSDNKQQNEFDINNIRQSHELVSRIEDNYINWMQLCQAGNIDVSKFNEWIELNDTKNMINKMALDSGIPEDKLIDKQNLWVHPDLAIQFAHWISPYFSLKVCGWIRKLFSNNKQDNIIKQKEQEIQQLKDTFVKKQPRKDYPMNVVYILTTPENKKNRCYIIGKAKVLKNRLSTYNKSAEHDVVYYKSCLTKENMDIVEKIVLDKLDKYKEKANRDRFILPTDKDLSFFTNIINKSANFLRENQF